MREQIFERKKKATPPIRVYWQGVFCTCFGNLPLKTVRVGFLSAYQSNIIAPIQPHMSRAVPERTLELTSENTLFLSSLSEAM